MSEEPDETDEEFEKLINMVKSVKEILETPVDTEDVFGISIEKLVAMKKALPEDASEFDDLIHKIYAIGAATEEEADYKNYFKDDDDTPDYYWGGVDASELIFRDDDDENN